MVKPRWELKIGAPVTATNSEYGQLKQLILDPHQERVVGLVLRRHALESLIRQLLQRESMDGRSPQAAHDVADLAWAAATEPNY